MFRLKGPRAHNVESVRAALLRLPARIPLIRKYELGTDLQLPSGTRNHPNGGPDRHVCWSAYFDSVEDYESHSGHEAHLAFLKDVLAPIVEPGSRSAAQYEVEEMTTTTKTDAETAEVTGSENRVPN